MKIPHLTNKNKLIRNLFLRYSSVTPLVVYLLLVFVSTLVLLWRYPNNLTHPNFYAEDGSVFLQNILDKGWLNSVSATFNGYFVIGIYLLAAFGMGLNWILNSGNLLLLPACFTFSSVLFMAAVISLPYLLFRKIFGTHKVLLIVLFSVLLPLPMSPHIVIGTLGNQKWIFIYLAFLVALYRILSYGKLRIRELIAIDLALFVSAYTNTTVYLIIPILFIPYIKQLWITKNKNGYKNSLITESRKTELKSLVILCAALLPQIIYVLINGIPRIEGYLDTAFNPSRAIELFINRTYLFDITHIVNGYLNDLVVIILFIFVFLGGWILMKRKERFSFFFGIYTAGVASILFTINRPGITDFFNGYSSSGSGPDQFFYAQSLIMYTPITLLLFAFTSLFKSKPSRVILILMLSVFFVSAGLYSNYKYVGQWRNASVFENSTGTFIDESIVACEKNHSKDVRVALYPFSDGRFSLKTSRAEICNNGLSQYQKTSDDLGLAPYNNNFFLINKNQQFYQKFYSRSNGLAGVRLYLSTFNYPIGHKFYKFELYDNTCKQLLKSVSLQKVIMDNSYYNVRFSPLFNSGGKNFCYSVKLQSDQTKVLALQLSKPDIYSKGEFRIKNSLQETDIVFEPLYDQKKP